MKIVILGGGVAGISSAIAFRQRGFDVSVYERATSPSTIGAGFVMWPNACFVLEQLELLDEIEAISGHPSQIRRYDHHGEHLGSINIRTINSRLGYSSLSVLRNEFQAVLHSKLASLGVRVRYSAALTGFTVYDDHVAARINNSETLHADLFIGADGRMSSLTRTQLLRASKPVYQNFVNWIGVCDADLDLRESMAIEDYWGVGKRFGIVPINISKTYWAGGEYCEEIGTAGSRTYLDELRHAFSGWPDPVQKMIDNTCLTSINKIFVHDHDPMKRWHNRNVVVIGDAAHAPLPTSGQGACQALEDAWHLVNCVANSSGDLELALTTFTRIRHRKTSGITSGARSFAESLFNTDTQYCDRRNKSAKTVNYAAMATGMADSWANGLPLFNH